MTQAPNPLAHFYFVCMTALVLCLFGGARALSGEEQPDAPPKKPLLDPGAGPEALPPIESAARIAVLQELLRQASFFIPRTPAPQAASAVFAAASLAPIPPLRAPIFAPIPAVEIPKPQPPVALSPAVLDALVFTPPTALTLRSNERSLEALAQIALPAFPILRAFVPRVEHAAPAVQNEDRVPVKLADAILRSLIADAGKQPAPITSPAETRIERAQSPNFPEFEFHASLYGAPRPPQPLERWTPIALAPEIQIALASRHQNSRVIESVPPLFAPLTPPSVPMVQIPALKPQDAPTAAVSPLHPFTPSPLQTATPSLLHPRVPGKLPEPGDLGANDLSEIVTLPAAPRAPIPAAPPAPLRSDEKIELALKLEKSILEPNEKAVLLLSGPEAFLIDAIAEYALTDELGRRILHEAVALRGIKAEESGVAPATEKSVKIRRIKLVPPVELALKREHARPGAPFRLHLDMSLHGGDKRQVQAGVQMTVNAAPEPMAQAAPGDGAQPIWDGWISLAANPPAKLSASDWDKLNKLGITGGMQYRLNAARRDALRAGDAPFFVENVSRQMLSRYHTERGLWEKTLADIKANPGSTAPLCRDPSLCSTQFADSFAAEIAKVADAFSNDRPLFFSLASEPSMTRLNLPADFDFSPAALEEFRRWLERDVYGTLNALNEEWGTHFESWQAIQPMTVEDARVRLKDGVGNFAPWADFREFQDYTFAKVLRQGGDQLRATIPNARAGITGAMGPFAYGGWDWSRLAAELDVVESYDIGCARALWRDLAPGKPALASIALAALAGENNAAARAELEHALWRFALEGGPRGALVWEAPGSEGALFNDAGEATEAAKSAAPILTQLASETGKILSHARREHDGVALLYSPASVRMYWLLEADRIPGGAWLEHWGADSSAERRESTQLRLRESWGKLLDDLGLGWRFTSSHELEKGFLSKPENGIKTLILPRAIALSDREAEAIKQFTASGGLVIADAVCGRFDEHGKVRPRAALDELFGVNTASEPAFARRMKPLERVAALPANEGVARGWDAAFLNNLPPVFSDEPKWNAPAASGLRRGAEYRSSPVLALGKNACYLNLDLTDYLRWRLEPDAKRAAATRRALLDAGLQRCRDAAPIDWEKSSLPPGTQISRLAFGKNPRAGFVLALRRNPQARMNELAADGDSNAVFEKPEAFKLVLREKCWLSQTLPATYDIKHSTSTIQHSENDAAPNRKSEALAALEGTLDPVAPKIFILHQDEPAQLSVKTPAAANKLAVISVALDGAPLTQGASESALYKIRVFGPDERERPHYGALVFSRDGALSHKFIPALNDPSGKWSVFVQNLTNGATATREILVNDDE